MKSIDIDKSTDDKDSQEQEVEGETPPKQVNTPSEQDRAPFNSPQKSNSVILDDYDSQEHEEQEEKELQFEQDESNNDDNCSIAHSRSKSGSFSVGECEREKTLTLQHPPSPCLSGADGLEISFQKEKMVDNSLEKILHNIEPQGQERASNEVEEESCGERMEKMEVLREIDEFMSKLASRKAEMMLEIREKDIRAQKMMFLNQIDMKRVETVRRIENASARVIQRHFRTFLMKKQMAKLRQLVMEKQQILHQKFVGQKEKEGDFSIKLPSYSHLRCQEPATIHFQTFGDSPSFQYDEREMEGDEEEEEEKPCPFFITRPNNTNSHYHYQQEDNLASPTTRQRRKMSLDLPEDSYCEDYIRPRWSEEEEGRVTGQAKRRGCGESTMAVPCSIERDFQSYEQWRSLFDNERTYSRNVRNELIMSPMSPKEFKNEPEDCLEGLERYYDYRAMLGMSSSLLFVGNGEGQGVVYKTVYLENTGAKPWKKCLVKPVGVMSGKTIEIYNVGVGEISLVTLELSGYFNVGTYTSHWKLVHENENGVVEAIGGVFEVEFKIEPRNIIGSNNMMVMKRGRCMTSVSADEQEVSPQYDEEEGEEEYEEYEEGQEEDEEVYEDDFEEDEQEEEEEEEEEFEERDGEYEEDDDDDEEGSEFPRLVCQDFMDPIQELNEYSEDGVYQQEREDNGEEDDFVPEEYMRESERLEREDEDEEEEGKERMVEKYTDYQDEITKIREMRRIFPFGSLDEMIEFVDARPQMSFEELLIEYLALAKRQ